MTWRDLVKSKEQEREASSDITTGGVTDITVVTVTISPPNNLNHSKQQVEISDTNVCLDGNNSNS